MTLKIGSNIASIGAQRSLADASSRLSNVYQRLSSGSRINSAGDDSAGLAISESLNLDARVYQQGARNLKDGQSILDTADAVVTELSDIVIRIRELAGQSANGSYSKVQRTAIDAEAQALSDEYLRIARSTKFNGINILDASGSSVNLQGGYGINGGLSVTTGGLIGNGTFSAAVTYVVGGSSSEAISFGDLNGDGKQDLVALNSVSGLSYAFGNGDGTFGNIITIALPIPAGSDLALGDLNGDGNLDFVVNGTTKVFVSLSNGNGTFGSVTSYAAENSVTNGISLADVNNDGVLDVITAGSDGANGATTIRLGTGTGTFGAATSYGISGTFADLTLGDINSDGNMDLIAIGTSAGSGVASVRLGNGSGSFGSATNYTMETSSSLGVGLADLNGDGILDLVSGGASASGSGTVTVRLGSGSGSFGAASSYVVNGSTAYALELEDINGDGLTDVVVNNNSSSGIGVAFGNGAGAFGAVISSNGDGFLGLALADLNGDGVLDIGLSKNGATSPVSIGLGNTQVGTASLLDFSLKTRADALQAIGILNNKSSQLNIQRGNIGAYQSRLGYALNNLSSIVENYSVAESRIKDVDVAEDSANLVKLKILQNAGTAVLAQANQQPSIVLGLLKA